MDTLFDMEMDEYGPTKPNPKAKRPKPLKRGTRKNRDQKLANKKKMKKLSYDVFQELKGKIPQRVKSPIEKDQDKVFKVIERHNKSLKKSPISVSGKKLATIPPRTKLIISSGQDLPTQAQAFAYDNDPTRNMHPYQYKKYLDQKKRRDKYMREIMQQQMGMNDNDSDSDGFEELSVKRKEYQEMKMQARKAKQLSSRSGGKRRRKKTRKRKGKGKKYGNLKKKEIKRSTFKPTNIDVVYGIDVDKMIDDERKSQQLLNKYNKTVNELKKTPFYKPKKRRQLSNLVNQYEFQLRNRQAREMKDSLIQTTNPEKQHYAKLGKDKDGNIIIPKGIIKEKQENLLLRADAEKQQSKKKKKGMQVLRMRKAVAAPRRIFGGRRSRKKKKLKKKKTRRRKAGKKVLQKRYTRKGNKRNTLTTIRERRARQQRIRDREGRNVINELDSEHFRRNIIDRGQLNNILTVFINNLNATLNNPRVHTRERYDAWSEMLDVVKEAITGKNLPINERRKILLMENLIGQLRISMESNIQLALLRGDSSDDEGNTEDRENVEAQQDD